MEILDADDRIFPELVANVNFLPEAAADSSEAGKTFLFVPRSAIVEDGGEMFAWVVAKSRVEKRRIKVSGASKDELARVDSGLSTGETVVLNPPRTLRDREMVKVAE